MSCTLGTKILCGFTVLLATAGLCFAESASNTPTILHAASSAVSGRLSDLPLAHPAQGVQDLKIVPPPKQPVPPRNIGPGGAARGDSAQQTHEGPPS